MEKLPFHVMRAVINSRLRQDHLGSLPRCTHLRGGHLLKTDEGVCMKLVPSMAERNRKKGVLCGGIGLKGCIKVAK
jgi:hypothetical protein